MGLFVKDQYGRETQVSTFVDNSGYEALRTEVNLRLSRGESVHHDTIKQLETKYGRNGWKDY